MSELKIGDRGFLAYLEAYVLEVEFVGFDAYEPDYPSEPTRYYRALERCDCEYKTIERGNIIDETGPHDEKLFANREEAEAVVKASAEYWLKRKEKELDELRKRARQT